MRFTLTFKTPDVLDKLIDIAYKNITDEDVEDAGDREALIEEKVGEVREFLEQWVKYGEQVTIGFDTRTNKATVLRNERD